MHKYVSRFKRSFARKRKYTANHFFEILCSLDLILVILPLATALAPDVMELLWGNDALMWKFIALCSALTWIPAGIASTYASGERLLAIKRKRNKPSTAYILFPVIVIVININMAYLIFFANAL